MSMHTKRVIHPSKIVKKKFKTEYSQRIGLFFGWVIADSSKPERRICLLNVPISTTPCRPTHRCVKVTRCSPKMYCLGRHGMLHTGRVVAFEKDGGTTCVRNIAFHLGDKWQSSLLSFAFSNEGAWRWRNNFWYTTNDSFKFTISDEPISRV